MRGVDWGFNAYGEMYHPYDNDALVARKVLEIEGVRRYRCPLVLEGGSFHVDGEGTCLVGAALLSCCQCVEWDCSHQSVDQSTRPSPPLGRI